MHGLPLDDMNQMSFPAESASSSRPGSAAGSTRKLSINKQSPIIPAQNIYRHSECKRAFLAFCRRKMPKHKATVALVDAIAEFRALCSSSDDLANTKQSRHQNAIGVWSLCKDCPAFQDDLTAEPYGDAGQQQLETHSTNASDTLAGISERLSQHDAGERMFDVAEEKALEHMAPAALDFQRSCDFRKCRKDLLRDFQIAVKKSGSTNVSHSSVFSNPLIFAAVLDFLECGSSSLVAFLAESQQLDRLLAQHRLRQTAMPHAVRHLFRTYLADAQELPLSTDNLREQIDTLPVSLGTRDDFMLAIRHPSPTSAQSSPASSTRRSSFVLGAAVLSAWQSLRAEAVTWLDDVALPRWLRSMSFAELSATSSRNSSGSYSGGSRPASPPVGQSRTSSASSNRSSGGELKDLHKNSLVPFLRRNSLSQSSQQQQQQQPGKPRRRGSAPAMAFGGFQTQFSSPSSKALLVPCPSKAKKYETPRGEPSQSTADVDLSWLPPALVIPPMAEAFGDSEVLQMFEAFCYSEHSIENLRFMLDIRKFRRDIAMCKSPYEAVAAAMSIFNAYFGEHSTQEICVSHLVAERIRTRLRQQNVNSTMFDECHQKVFYETERDTFKRFCASLNFLRLHLSRSLEHSQLGQGGCLGGFRRRKYEKLQAAMTHSQLRRWAGARRKKRSSSANF